MSPRATRQAAGLRPHLVPSSALAVWPAIVTMAAQLKPRRVLDVGPGYGKGAILFREYVRTVTRIDALEVEPRYVRDFWWLERIYDRVTVGDVRLFPAGFFGHYDLVLLIDVIEHMSTTEGLDLLARIPGHVIVSTPAAFFQNPEHTEYPSETHRSVWSAVDFGDRVIGEDADAAAIGGVLVLLAPTA